MIEVERMNRVRVRWSETVGFPILFAEIVFRNFRLYTQYAKEDGATRRHHSSAILTECPNMETSA